MEYADVNWAFELVHFCTSSNDATHKRLLYTLLVVALYATSVPLKRAAKPR